jgi:signal peptidase I
MSSRKPAHGKSPPAPPAAKQQPAVGKPPAAPTWPHSLFGHAAVRETIESIVVAVVLAFLIRTFEAEAFVIPTGSMAPALMGCHKDLQCPVCSCPFQVSASGTQDENGDTKTAQVDAGICPMCRKPFDLRGGSYPNYNGDRVLVDKFCYQVRPLERWDVVVFHYPGDASKNYIKRLAGLPGETLWIKHGALWTRPNGQPERPFHIARKPPEKLLSMLEPVFDNDDAPAIENAIINPGPERWGGNGWQSPDGKQFETVPIQREKPVPATAWLRYEHRVPSFDIDSGSVRTVPRPALISDFLAYDTGQPGLGPQESLGLDWVGDLALECTVQPRAAQGQVVFELVKGGRRFRCQIDLKTGQAVLSISGPGAEDFHPTAKTALTDCKPHRILFANADDRLLLWIDGRLVPASDQKAEGKWSATTCYDSEALNAAAKLKTYLPTEADLSPVGIGSWDAALLVSHLKIMRNIYYIADKVSAGEGQHPRICEFTGPLPDLADSATWDRFNYVRKDVRFSLKPDQFFMLGDNSACSADGRLWRDRYWVDRDLLIGRALVIYWPHSWDKVAIGGHEIPFPYFPNFRKMGFVR